MEFCKDCQQEQSNFKQAYSDMGTGKFVSEIISNWKCTVDENGEHHSFNGESACIDDEETEMWFNHGKLHRVGAPALIWKHHGVVEWHVDDDPHREDGPCIYSTKREYGQSEHDSWCWHGKWAQEVYQPLYVSKVLEFTYCSPSWNCREKMGVVCEKINQYFYRVLCGNKKILVVDLSSWDKKSTITDSE